MKYTVYKIKNFPESNIKNINIRKIGKQKKMIKK